jgi:hypothetical protein
VVLALLIAVVVPLAIAQLGRRHLCTAMTEMWTRQVPADVTLPRVPEYLDECSELSAGTVVFIGDRIRRGAHDLGARSDLDTDEGCAALTLALDRETRGSGALRIAADGSLSATRVECLTRALASPALRDTDMGGVVHRKPRCSVEWLGMAGTGDQGTFPYCVPSALAGPECPDPQGGYPNGALLVAPDTLVVHKRVDGHLEARAAPPPTRPDDGAWWPLEPLGPSWIGAQNPARLQEIVSLLDVPALYTQNAPWMRLRTSPDPRPKLVPSERVTAAREPPALPDDPFVAVGRWLSFEASDPLAKDQVEPLRASLEERIVRCQLLQRDFLEAGRNAFSYFASVAADGSVRALWLLDAPKDEDARACSTRAVADLRFPARGHAYIAYVSASVYAMHAKVDAIEVTGVDTADGEHVLKAARALGGAMMDRCYAEALRRDRRTAREVLVKFEVLNGVITSTTYDPDYSSQGPEAACAAKVLRTLKLPALKKPVREFQIEVRFMPAHR